MTSTARVHKSRENSKRKLSECKSIVDLTTSEDMSVEESQRVLEAKQFMNSLEMRKVARVEKKKKKRYEKSNPQFDIRTELIPPPVLTKGDYSEMLATFQALLPEPTNSLNEDFPSLLREFDVEGKTSKTKAGKRSGRWFHSGSLCSVDEDSVENGDEFNSRNVGMKLFLRRKLNMFLNMIWSRNDAKRHKVVHYTIILKKKGNIFLYSCICNRLIIFTFLL